MKLNLKGYSLLFVMSVVILSCNDSLFNSGDTITKNIEIEYFKEIYVNDIFDIYLMQDTVCKISVNGGSNLIPNIEFKVDMDKKLYIDNLNNARWSREYEKIKLYISVDSLKFLRLNSPSNVQCIDTLKTAELKVFSIADYADIEINISCDNFYLVNSETSGGVITISGKTNSFGFFARASLQINAENFISNYVYVETESIGDCSINVNKELTVEISRTGNVYYKGNPDTIIYVNEKAKNQLIKID